MVRRTSDAGATVLLVRRASAVVTVSVEGFHRRELMLVVVGTFVFYAGFGMSFPVIPRYVGEVLAGGDVAVGVAFGTYAVAAVLVRPFVGAFGDRWGRRPLFVSGALITSAGMFAHVAADTLLLLLAVRLVVGIGVAAVMVAVTTMAIDLAPITRRGEAASYVMMALQLGLGFGPFAGELFVALSYDAVWVAAGLASAGVAVVPFLLAAEPPRRSNEPMTVTSALRALTVGVRPGIVLAFGTVGFIGFLAFVPLFGAEIGLGMTAPAFLAASGTVGVVRLLFARVPDKLGPIAGSTLSLSLIAVGMLGMSAWQTPLGLYLFVLPMAAGAALLFPSLLLAALTNVEESERSRVVAGFTLYIDLVAALGPMTLGLVASVSTYATGFAVAGGTAIFALILVHHWLAPQVRLAEPGNR